MRDLYSAYSGTWKRVCTSHMFDYTCIWTPSFSNKIIKYFSTVYLSSVDKYIFKKLVLLYPILIRTFPSCSLHFLHARNARRQRKRFMQGKAQKALYKCMYIMYVFSSMVMCLNTTQLCANTTNCCCSRMFTVQCLCYDKIMN